MDEMGAGPSIVAKAMTLVNAVADSWAVVGNYVGSPECASILEVTPLECGREMYSDVEWILWTTFSWWLPHLTDLMAGLSLTMG